MWVLILSSVKAEFVWFTVCDYETWTLWGTFNYWIHHKQCISATLSYSVETLQIRWHCLIMLHNKKTILHKIHCTRKTPALAHFLAPREGLSVTIPISKTCSYIKKRGKLDVVDSVFSSSVFVQAYSMKSIKCLSNGLDTVGQQFIGYF